LYTAEARRRSVRYQARGGSESGYRDRRRTESQTPTGGDPSPNHRASVHRGSASAIAPPPPWPARVASLNHDTRDPVSRSIIRTPAVASMFCRDQEGGELSRSADPRGSPRAAGRLLIASFVGFVLCDEARSLAMLQVCSVCAVSDVQMRSRMLAQ